MRLFHASTARRSASLRASVARSAAARTDARRKWSHVTCCPCERRIAGPRGTGKPLQIAVDNVTGTTEATQRPKRRQDQASTAAMASHLHRAGHGRVVVLKRRLRTPMALGSKRSLNLGLPVTHKQVGGNFSVQSDTLASPCVL